MSLDRAVELRRQLTESINNTTPVSHTSRIDNLRNDIAKAKDYAKQRTLEETLAKLKRDEDIMKKDPTVKKIKTSLDRETQISAEERAKYLKGKEYEIKRNATARKQGKELPYPEAEEAVTTDPRNVTYSSPGLKKVEAEILKALDTAAANEAAEKAAAALKLQQQLLIKPIMGLPVNNLIP